MSDTSLVNAGEGALRIQSCLEGEPRLSGSAFCALQAGPALSEAHVPHVPAPEEAKLAPHRFIPLPPPLLFSFFF